MASLSLAFDILAKDRASGVFRDVGNAAEKAGKQGHTAGSLIGSGMKLAAAGLLGGGIIAGFKGLYEAAAESQKVGRLTTQVIKSTGGAAGVTAGQVSDLAAAISRKTGVDDEAIQSGENLLLTFTNVRNEAGKGNDVFNQATSILTDMSVALGQDAKSSALQLGKALNDPIRGVTALQRVGVSFTAAQREQIGVLVESGRTMDAQKIILAELSKEFGGAAEAAATPFDKLKVTLGNLAEEAGGRLVPVVNDLSNFLIDDLLPAVGNLEPVFDAAGNAIGFVADTGGKLLDFFNDLPGPVKTTTVAVGALVLLRNPLSSFFGAVRSGAETAALKTLYMKDALSSVSGAAGAMKRGASGLVGFLGGPWGAALTGATLGLSLLVDWLGKSDNVTSDLTAAQQSLTDAIKATNGALDESVRRAAAEALQKEHLLDFTELYGVSSRDLVGYVLGEADAHDRVTAALQRYRGQLEAKLTGDKDADLITQGLIGAVDTHRAALDGLASSTSSTVASEKQLATATGEAASGMGGASAAAQQLFADLQDTADAASEARQQTDLYKTALDLLSGNTVSLIEVESTLQDALAASQGAMEGLKGEVLQANGQFNLQSEAGRKAADVLLGVQDAGNQVIATMIQQGATEEQVRQKDAQLRESFINTARQMGIGQQEAEKLADQILGIPSSRNTTITADTAPARGALNGLINDYRGYTINLGLGGIDRYAAADGGILPGYTPGKDVHHFVSRTAGALSLSGGEAIMRPEWTQAVGSNFVGRMNKLAKTSGAAGVRRAMGFAEGGIFPPDWMGGMVLRAAIDPGALARTRKELLEPSTGAVAALAWVKSQVGKPYLWGGVGPTGYDCSGLISAVANVIRGRNPHSRLGSTANFPWSGFSPGLFGSFQIGSTANAGGGIGHMAGSLLGVPVESAGGVGVRVGSSARSATNGLFTTRASFRYDQGGLLPPGLTVAVNGTGKPETIRTAEQEAALQGRGSTYVTHVHAANSPEAVARAVEQRQRINDFLYGR